MGTTLIGEPGTPERPKGTTLIGKPAGGGTRIAGPLGSSGEAASRTGDRQEGPVVGWLVILDGPGVGRSLPLGYGMNIIGRGAGNRIVLDFGDQQISEDDHFRIAYDRENRKFHLVPGRGTNLVYVSGSPLLSPVDLQAQQDVKVGMTLLASCPSAPRHGTGRTGPKSEPRRAGLARQWDAVGDRGRPGDRCAKRAAGRPRARRDPPRRWRGGVARGRRRRHGRRGRRAPGRRDRGARLPQRLRGRHRFRRRPAPRDALLAANAAVDGCAATDEELAGMGCTLVALALARGRATWISVGDSLLLRLRGRRLERLNADHSMGPAFDEAARAGEMSIEEAASHPNRGSFFPRSPATRCRCRRTQRADRARRPVRAGQRRPADPSLRGDRRGRQRPGRSEPAATRAGTRGRGRGSAGGRAGQYHGGGGGAGAGRPTLAHDGAAAHRRRPGPRRGARSAPSPRLPAARGRNSVAKPPAWTPPVAAARSPVQPDLRAPVCAPGRTVSQGPCAPPAKPKKKPVSPKASLEKPPPDPAAAKPSPAKSTPVSAPSTAVKPDESPERDVRRGPDRPSRS